MDRSGKFALPYEANLLLAQGVSKSSQSTTTKKRIEISELRLWEENIFVQNPIYPFAMGCILNVSHVHVQVFISYCKFLPEPQHLAVFS